MTTNVSTPVVKKTAPRKAAASKTAAVAAEIIEEQGGTPPTKKKVARKPTVIATVAPAVYPDQRHQLIQLAAYYIAERRGFTGVSSDEDWLQAEQDVDALIAAGQL
jgi:hypothetical protein